MERERIVSTSDGEIRYTLIKKRIKNLNLRLRAGGDGRALCAYGVYASGGG